MIAALLLDEDAISRVLPIVQPADFFREQHAWCYEASIALTDRGEPITIPTLAHELDRAVRLDAVGGESWIVELVGRHYTAAGVEAHARIVARDARYRRLITAGGQIAQFAYEGGPDASAVLAASLGLLTGLITDRDTGLERLGHASLTETMGAQWGIPALDKYTTGLTPGRLTIAAGRKGSGKSMLAAQIVHNIATAGLHVAIYTMEMVNGEYQNRIAHAMAAVKMHYNNYEPPYTERETALLDEARGQIAEWGILASDKSGMTVEMIAAGVKVANAERHIDLVVVDYLQLMGGKDPRNIAESMKHITGSLKTLASSVGCHVLAVSQMNRAAHTEMRAGTDSSRMRCIITDHPYPEPFVEGLMGGAIENDADLVVMLQRHSGCEGARHMEVCIAANRHGPTGHGMLIENYALARLEPLTREDVSRVAAGSTKIYRALMADQGYSNAQYVPGQPPPAAPMHNAYVFDAKTEGLLNAAAALDPEQRRAQTTDEPWRFDSPAERAANLNAAFEEDNE